MPKHTTSTSLDPNELNDPNDLTETILTGSHFCYLSNSGALRRKNEDSLLLNHILLFEKEMTQPECVQLKNQRNLAVVADGLGGHSKGELASRTVLEVLQQLADQIIDESSLLAALKQAKQKLDSIVREDFTLLGLGTTLAGISMEGTRTLFFNCGDCRIYRLTADKGLEKITKDHSLVQRLVDRGRNAVSSR